MKMEDERFTEQLLRPDEIGYRFDGFFIYKWIPLSPFRYLLWDELLESPST